MNFGQSDTKNNCFMSLFGQTALRNSITMVTANCCEYKKTILGEVGICSLPFQNRVNLFTTVQDTENWNLSSWYPAGPHQVSELLTSVSTVSLYYLLYGNWYRPAFIQCNWLIYGHDNTIRTTFFMFCRKSSIFQVFVVLASKILKIQ